MYCSYSSSVKLLLSKLIVDLKEFMSLKKTSYLFRLEDDFRREMMDKLRANRKNNKIKK